MKLQPIKLPEKLEPFRGVIFFAVILMTANFFWKYNVLGDEAANLNSSVTFWGWDISAPFTYAARNVAHACEFALNTIGWDVKLKPDNSISHPNGRSVLIIWACTGLKQAYIFFCIIAFYRGPWKKKLWYIPLGLGVVYLFNIFRISFIIAAIKNHPDWFAFLHEYAFKYIFYGIIFLMWAFWDEKVAPQKESNKSKITESTNN